MLWMPVALTFIIPVRHQDNAKDWDVLKANLAQTVRSISAQTIDDWQAVIVANEGADLPRVPNHFSVKFVNFPPNKVHDRSKYSIETATAGIRLDKGKRILAGLLHARDVGHIMVVDDDDFISNRLAEFVAQRRHMTGWVFSQGYGWKDGDKFLYLASDFHNLCGTSHIIKGDILQLPHTIEDASEEYLRQMLGSHRFIAEHLDKLGLGLTPLPFPGAIYRIGHAGNWSGPTSLWRKFFLNKTALARPTTLFTNCSRLRVMNHRIRSEFFGARPT